MLDEFSDLTPKEEEAARIVALLVRTASRTASETNSQRPSPRLALAGYSLLQEDLQRIVGEHAFLHIEGRQHAMERCVVALLSNDPDVLLSIVAQLTLKALSPGVGGVIVFLPGWKEITTVQKRLMAEWSNLDIVILHSDSVGDEDEDAADVSSVDNALPVILSTVIGARTLTYKNLRFCIIHPACRSESLHPSGIKRLQDEKVSEELEGNMAGGTGITAQASIFGRRP